MKKRTNRNTYVFSAFFVMVVCVVVLLLIFDKKSSNKISLNETLSSEVKLTKKASGGFYLYDKEKQPIMNNHPIKIGIDETLEFNIECVNTCEVELNYSLAILINDYYQEVSYKRESGSFPGKGEIQGMSSEMINAKFKVNSYNRDGKNELRIIMFYYPKNIPKDDLDQVPVGDSVGVYPIQGSIADNVKFDNKLHDMKSHNVSAEQGIQAVWLTEKEHDAIPEFDFILDIKDQKSIYFNSLGEKKSYRGMVFVDGVPIKVNKNYVFGWEQAENCLLNYKITSGLAGGNTIFAYMYEKGVGIEGTYITDLYKINN